MIKYTIHTENKNLKGIERILQTHLVNAGYTIKEVLGSWKGKKEKALEIVIIHDTPLNVVLKAVAARIRDLNKQEVVLITAEKIEAELV